MAIATAVPHTTLALDEHYGSGPISSKLMTRTLLVYAAIFILGIMPAMLHWPASWQAAGLGLIFPGGGFIAAGGWTMLLFPLTAGLMLVALASWVLMANLFAPLLVWIGSIVLAAALVGDNALPAARWVVPLIAIGFLGWVIQLHWRIAAGEIKRRDARNAYLPRAEQAVLARATPRPAPGSREMSQADVANLRYALDRGLQPVESLQGFDVIEQFQTSSIRYQLNYLLWALQVAQCHYTPNFHGYLSQAQRNLIDKLTVPKVWKWWRWENLFGNFSLNFDPIAKDNIMFGGFSSANVALYTANTGDDHYLQTGSLTFRENATRSYQHSLRTMLDNGRYNHSIAVYGPLYPCEPRLTYSACNLWGNFQHLIGDRVLGTEYREQLIAQLKPLHISEMLRRDGLPHAGRITTLGIRIPVYTCNHVSAIWGWMASAFFPDLSRRVWAILRTECVSFDEQGEITLATESYDRMDTGNYRKSEAGIHAQFLVLAREHGDDEVADAILRKLDREFDRNDLNGTVSYNKSSNVNNATIIMGRLMRHGDVHSMVLDGPPESTLRGPLLSEVSYPGVLVAKAYSDGRDLNLVLYPGTTQTRQYIRFERLQPGREYAVEGMMARTLKADDQGHAQLDIDLPGRTEIRLVPQQ